MPEYTFTTSESLPGNSLAWEQVTLDGEQGLGAFGASEGDDRSNRLRLTGWGFEIPPDRTLQEVAVKITAYAEDEDGEGHREDLSWWISIGGFRTELDQEFGDDPTTHERRLNASVHDMPIVANLLTDRVEVEYEAGDDVDVILRTVRIELVWA